MSDVKADMDTGEAQAVDLRQEFRVLRELLYQLPPSDRRTIALTQLEGAAMWAIKAAYRGDR